MKIPGKFSRHSGFSFIRLSLPWGKERKRAEREKEEEKKVREDDQLIAEREERK